MQVTFKRFGALLAGFLLAAIIWFVARNYKLDEIFAQLSKFTSIDLIVIPLLVVTNFTVLSLVDFVALKTVVRSGFRYPPALLSSFVASAFSYNLGAPAVVGAFFRFKILSKIGVTSKQILDAIILVSFHYWVALVVSFCFVSLLTSVLGYQKIFSPSVSAIMTLISSSALVYYFFFLEKRRILRVFNLKFLTPPRPVTQKILLLCICDWVVHSAVFYMCIPGHDVHYLELAVPFLLSHILALLSNIPGGFGLFESTGFLTLKHSIQPEALIAGLLVYRLFMYIIPLILAAVTYAIFELKTEAEIRGEE